MSTDTTKGTHPGAEPADPPEDAALEALSALSQGRFDGLLGVRFTRATADEVVAELDVRPEHCQSYGIVHGGVYASLVETVASVGAALSVMPEGRSAVGLENHTSFLRAVRGGTIRAAGKPLVRGARSHVWEVAITDERGTEVANGRVRMIVLDQNAVVAGEKVELK
jgi:uncharacterized protein (TIGR00369 family)